MEFIKPKQRKSHKHDPIVKSILIKAILTLHTTEAKLGKPILPSVTYSKVLRSVQFLVFYFQFQKTSILNTSKFWPRCANPFELINKQNRAQRATHASPLHCLAKHYENKNIVSGRDQIRADNAVYFRKRISTKELASLMIICTFSTST